MKMKFIWTLFSLVCIALSLNGQHLTRTEVNIPDIPGYYTLKCDFHTHTVFSDGYVWPTIRSQEGWAEGFHVIAITDHIEYQPHKEDIPTNFNRSHELAEPAGEDLGLHIIRGAEITRDEPPGHLNAIFLQDVPPLEKLDFRDAVEEAIKQDALVFWNHPGWKQPGRQSVWYDTQEELLQKGWLHGIEVVNTDTYYPNAHKWCLEKDLIMFGNSDRHRPIPYRYDPTEDHRVMTLVFTKDHSLKAVKDALLDRRTAIYWQDTLIGREKFLQPLFENSITIATPEITLQGERRAIVQVTNHSDIPFSLTATESDYDLIVPDQLTLPARRTSAFSMRATSRQARISRKVELPFMVTNLWTAPNQGLPVTLELRVNRSSAE